jgi:hypothetical protein
VELEADKSGGIILYLVTEPVQPLSTLLHELRLAGTQRCGATRADAQPAGLRGAALTLLGAPQG